MSNDPKLELLEFRLEHLEIVLDRCDVLMSKTAKLITKQEVQAASMEHIKEALNALKLDLKEHGDKTDETIKALKENNESLEKTVVSITKLVYATPVACVTIILGMQKLFPL